MRWVLGLGRLGVPMLLILAPLAGCTRQPRADLDHYVRVELPKLAPYESQLQDDEAATRGLAPVARRYVAALEAIKPVTQEVRALHGLKLEAARTEADALSAFEQALARNDPSLGNLARERFKRAKRERRAFEERLTELERENGVKPPL